MELRLPISSVGVRISAVFPRKQRVSALVVHSVCRLRSSTPFLDSVSRLRFSTPFLEGTSGVHS